jgi:tetratricopeptide (TPR) repeat protein
MLHFSRYAHVLVVISVVFFSIVGTASAQDPLYSPLNDSANQELNAELQYADKLLNKDQKPKDALAYLSGLSFGDTSEQEIKIQTEKAIILCGYLVYPNPNTCPDSNQILEDLIKKYPNDYYSFWPRKALADNYLSFLPPKERDYIKARELLQRVLIDYPVPSQSFVIEEKIAWTYYYERDYITASDIFKKIINSTPEHDSLYRFKPYCLYNLGSCYCQMKQFPLAVEAWRIATENFPEDSWANAARLMLSAHGPAPQTNGDISGDGVIRTEDVLLCLRYLIQNVELTLNQRVAADVNHNFDVDIRDANTILRKVLGL